MEFADINDQLGADALLLLPQRKYRDILKKARAGTTLTLDLLSAEDDSAIVSTDYSDFIEQNRGSYTITDYPDVQISSFERTLASQAKAMKLICEFLTISGIGALHCTCRSVRDMYDLYVGEVRLPLEDFNRFVKHKLELGDDVNSSVIGLLHGKSLTCGHPYEAFCEKDCSNLTKFFVEDNLTTFSLAVKSLCLPLVNVLDSTIVSSLFESLSSVGECLHFLNLEGSALGFDGISMFCDALNHNCLPNLLSLNLNRNQATVAGIRKLRASLFSSKCPYLQDLRISNNRALVSALEYFEIVPLPRKRIAITALDCSQNSLDFFDTEVAALFNRGSLDIFHVQELDLSYNPIGDSGLISFLQSVCIAPGQLGQIRVPKSILGIPPLALTTLKVVSAGIGNSTVHYLSQMMVNGMLPHLRVLYLGLNEIGAVGVESLTQALLRLQPHCPLCELSLTMNNIGNDGIAAIIAAVVAGSMDNIKSLDVADCGAVMDGISRLARALTVPGARVSKLKKLRLFGSQFPPIAIGVVRPNFPAEFRQRVEIQ